VHIDGCACLATDNVSAYELMDWYKTYDNLFVALASNLAKFFKSHKEERDLLAETLSEFHIRLWAMFTHNFSGIDLMPCLYD